MMKQIYTVTPCIWNSYGSILQALGLQKTLEALGYGDSIIKCEKFPDDKLKWTIPKAATLKRQIVNFHKAIIYKQLNRRYQNTNQFLEENLQITYCGSYESLRKSPPKAAAYIAGSDQIWNPQNMRPFFYLDFAEPGARRIAYAASMGVLEMPEEKAEQFRQYVSRFDSVSVRERDNVPIVQKCTDQPVLVHIDPVFLLGKEEWRSYERCYPDLPAPYILVFAIYWDKRLNKQLKQLHADTGLDIVLVSGGLQQVYANRRIYDADPGQFLWLIDHAEAVVSSSFHGAAMSVLFNKRLSAVINPSAPSRISCLLETLGVNNLPVPELSSDKKQDYTAVNARIQEEQRRSEAYLREALDGV